MCVQFFFRNKPKAPSVCKLFTIYSVCVCVFFCTLSFSFPVIWCACLFYPVGSVSPSSHGYYDCCVFVYALYQICMQLQKISMYLRLDQLYLFLSPSVLGPLVTVSLNVKRLKLYLSICFVWDVELNCRFRSVDVNTALS